MKKCGGFLSKSMPRIAKRYEYAKVRASRRAVNLPLVGSAHNLSANTAKSSDKNLQKRRPRSPGLELLS